MIRILALILAAAAASPVSALSCIPTDVTRSYSDAATSDKLYVVLLGRYDFNTRELPKTD